MSITCFNHMSGDKSLCKEKKKTQKKKKRLIHIIRALTLSCTRSVMCSCQNEKALTNEGERNLLVGVSINKLRNTNRQTRQINIWLKCGPMNSNRNIYCN